MTSSSTIPQNRNASDGAVPAPTQTGAPALSFDRVFKAYDTAQNPIDVLRGASFAIAPGESVALTGESGSGKSTILHLAAGLDDFDSGRIVVAGREIGTLDDAGKAQLRRERIGVVFQQFNLIPSLTVKDNLAFQARLAGRVDAGWLRNLSARLGLEDLWDRYPEQLSGGQQQRVAIGRALAGRPPLVLADEPTGNLDEKTSDEVIALALDLVATTGSSLLMVTHSERIAALLDRRLHLAGGLVA